MEENILTVKLDNRNIDIEVIDIIENNENNKKYIIYTIIGNDEDVYMSILEEYEDSFLLKTIEDANEAKMLEDYLEELSENGEL